MFFGMFTCHDYTESLSMSELMFEYDMLKFHADISYCLREINSSIKYVSRNRAAIFITAQFATLFSELTRLTRGKQHKVNNMRLLFKNKL